VDIDNHGMDAMRYAVMSQDGQIGRVEHTKDNPFTRRRR